MLDGKKVKSPQSSAKRNTEEGPVMSGYGSTVPRWSLFLGNAFEHYDMALFGLLSPFLANLFFADYAPVTALILTYCIMPLGMAARPLGSLFFGYIGDKRGRKEALVLALTGMAMTTVIMGLLPTCREVGSWAPCFLALGRMVQNFFSAGETTGGGIYLMEHTPPSQQDKVSGIYGASTVAGLLFASLGVSLLCSLGLIDDYWRLLYLLGCFTALFALFLRNKMTASVSPRPVPFSLREALRVCWIRREAVVRIAMAAGFSYASYAMALVMINGFVPLVSSVSIGEMMQVNALMLGIDLALLPIFGWVAGRYSREKMMKRAGFVAAISAFPLFWLLQGASLTVIILIRLVLLLIGVWFSAPFYAWAQQQLPASDRYTVVSFAYAIGSQLIGGPTAAISLWLFHTTGSVGSAALYWAFLGLCMSGLLVRACNQVDDQKRPSYGRRVGMGLWNYSAKSIYRPIANAFKPNSCRRRRGGMTLDRRAPKKLPAIPAAETVTITSPLTS